MRAAIYARVSTEEQAKEGTSLQSQTAACMQKAKELGFEVPETYVFSENFSGLTTERLKLTALRNLAKNDELLKTVIIYAPDRLSRVGEDILNLVKEFAALGIKLTFVKMQFDDSLTGKFLAFTLGWSSEFEAAQIKERTMRGKKVMLSRGFMPQGTGKGLYGYKWDTKLKKRIPLEHEAKVVNIIFSLITEGKSLFAVADILNNESVPTKACGKWHPLTVKRIVTNTAYIGDTYFGRTKRVSRSKIAVTPKEDWVLLKDITPPIISRELFEKANEALTGTRRARHGKTLHKYLLSGHISCGHCNSPIVGSCLNKKYRYYYCTGNRSTSHRAKICQSLYTRADELEGLIWGKIKEILSNPQTILSELQRQAEMQKSERTNNAFDKEIPRLRHNLRKYDFEEKRLIALFRHDEISKDNILDEINKLKREREQDKQKLYDLEKSRNEQDKILKAKIHLDEMIGIVCKNIDRLTFDEKRLVFDALQIQIKTADGEIQLQGALPASYVTIEQTSA